MVTAFEFATAGRIVFGEGRLKELPAATKSFGKRVLFVCGQNPERASAALRLLGDAGMEVTTCCLDGEPHVEAVERGAALARQAHADVIVGYGGGSALDAAKAIAALATNDGSIFDYLEVVGRAMPLQLAPLPVVAVPTTAGTGAEVTRNAVIFSPEHRVKASLRHPGMLPRIALVDPELTYSLPPNLTASTGMDALTQLIEPFVCARANPLTDALCRQAIPMAARALERVFLNGADNTARREMCVASLFGGLALANAGLGAVHGFAAPIGGMFNAPHGAVCASLLPGVMRMNLRAAEANQDSATLRRYQETGRLLAGSDKASADDGVKFVQELCQALRIPRLRDFGIVPNDLPLIAEKAAQASSMKANPVALTTAQLVEILQEAL